LSKLCIIPARGGSKRIPRKNIKSFLGKPIIVYSITAALESGIFDEVIVSTDDQEIADVAESYGAKVPFMRSQKNSDDFASTMDVVNEVVDFYIENDQIFQYICCIYATSPLIRIQHLREGLSKLKSFHFDSVFPIVAFSYPIWRSLKIEGKHVQMNWPEYKKSRSQDLPVAYHDAGQWYWICTSQIKNELFTENSGYVLLEETQVQDIDNEDDWLMAEMKYEKLQGTQ